MPVFLNQTDYVKQLESQLGALSLETRDAGDENSWQLYEKLCSRWQEQQHLSLTEYINIVLYDNEFGYYSSGKSPIGKAADFVTAPEISELFAAALATYITNFLDRGGVNLVELGAGNGTLAKQLLARLPKSFSNYYIVEVSPSLKKRQKAHLLNSNGETYVTWLDSIKDIPENSLIIGNEVLDAIPAHFFRHDNGYFSEASWNPLSPFEYDWSEILSKDLVNWLLIHWDKLKYSSCAIDSDYIYEASPLRTRYVTEGLSHLKNVTLLMIDYGYGAEEFYHPQRQTGTLKAFVKHKQHSNVCWLPGQQDISSHVNFSEMCYALESSGWTLRGYCNQSQLILGSNILHHLELKPELLDRLKESRSLQKLMMPSEMGETVKAIAFTKNIVENAAISIPDHLIHRL